MKHTNVVFIALMSLMLSTPSLGKQRPITQGRPLPTLSATAASGCWLERAALNPITYGKVGGTSPANSPEAKIVLYTPTLSEAFFKLAQQVDMFVGKHPELKWSFVQVRDPKGAQRGGYSTDELQVRLSAIKTLVESHGIQHLSFLISAPPARPGDTTISLAYTAPTPSSPEDSLVRWTAQRNDSELDKSAIAKLMAELSATIGK